MNAYNNEPGSGRTGFHEIPPNNYEWYSEDEKYKPNVQADGGILSREQARPVTRRLLFQKILSPRNESHHDYRCPEISVTRRLSVSCQQRELAGY